MVNKLPSNLNDSTPLAMLTIADLRSLMGYLKTSAPEESSEMPSEGRRYVYGLKGLAELFHVSTKTAMIYKNGILKDACYQSGRTIIVDADKALELFKGRE